VNPEYNITFWKSLASSHYHYLLFNKKKNDTLLPIKLHVIFHLADHFASSLSFTSGKVIGQEARSERHFTTAIEQQFTTVIKIRSIIASFSN